MKIELLTNMTYRNIFQTVLFILLLSPFHKQWAQAVSHPTGFYSEDSLFFTIDTVPPPGYAVEFSINCFTDEVCYKPYRKGVWLYNRNGTPNTWENQPFSKAPMPRSASTIDASAPRGKLDKVNVVKFRLKDKNGKIVHEKAYFIGLLGKGAAYPYKVPVVHLLVDSAGAFGEYGFYGPGKGEHIEISGEQSLVWNYLLDHGVIWKPIIPRERIEKKCIIEILDTDNTSSLYQACGVRLSGNTSRHYPNKTLAVVAREEYSGTNRFATDLFGDTILYKWLRFRAGGSAQQEAFGSHEIAERILSGLQIGEQDIRPVITFINGSYWSLSFAQDKVKEYTVERIFGIKHNDVDLIGINAEISQEFVSSVEKWGVDTSAFIWMNLNSSPVCIGVVREGSKERFSEPARILLEGGLGKRTLSFGEIDSLLDIDRWVNFLAVEAFAGFRYLARGIIVATAPGKKMFPLLNEGDFFGGNSPYGPVLAQMHSEVDTTFTFLVFANVILKNEKCVELFVIRCQDLLNTWFTPMRTTRIVDELAADFMPEYEKHKQSWGVNGGLDIDRQRALIKGIRTYCELRPNMLWEQLASTYIKEKYNLADRKTVSLVMDSLPSNLISVKINTLSHDTSFTGLYYPSPALHISADTSNLPKGTRIKWKEFPDYPMEFTLNARTNITLTPILYKVRPK